MTKLCVTGYECVGELHVELFFPVPHYYGELVAVIADVSSKHLSLHKIEINTTVPKTVRTITVNTYAPPFS